MMNDATVPIHRGYGNSKIRAPWSVAGKQQNRQFGLVQTSKRRVAKKKTCLVGGFNPSEKYKSSQIGSFPQVGVKINHI